MRFCPFFIAFAALSAMAVSDARADGCFVWNKGVDLNEPSQKAILCHRGGIETMVLQVKYEGPAEDFAWIVPLPAKPEIRAVEADKSPFGEISLYTQRRARWGRRGPMDEGAKQQVTVLERKIVGVYDVATLAASDGNALATWLNKNGYAFPKDRAEVLDHYAKKEWVYVAMRIDRKALAGDEVKKLKVGELQPVCFRFASKEMVYPLKISSVNAGKTEVLLYLLADAPMVLCGENPPPGFSIRQNIPAFLGGGGEAYQDPEFGTYRKVDGRSLPLTWESLKLPKEISLSLCKYRSLYETKQMTDDLTFARFGPLPYWEARLETAQHPSTKLEIVGLLIRHDKDKYTKALQDILAGWTDSANEADRRRAASHPGAPARLLRQLAGDEHLNVRCAVAANPNTPVDVLTRLASDEQESVLGFVARNPAAPPELLGKLADRAGPPLAFALCENPGFPLAGLWKLARSKSPHVRACAAKCKRSPEKLLAALAADKEYAVRVQVALNPGTPAASLAELAKDENGNIRDCVAANPKTPADILVVLSKDSREDVRRRVAANPNTPKQVLVELAEDEDVRVRESAATCPTMPPEILSRLARDTQATVRSRVAGNPGASTKTLIRLACDGRPDVRQLARRTLHGRGVAPYIVPKIPKEEIARNLPPDVRKQIERLYSADASERATAARSLGKMGRAARGAVPHLVAVLDDRASAALKPEMRGTNVHSQAAAALLALAEHIKPGDPAAATLAEALQSWDGDVRLAALAALERTGDARAAELLLAAFDDPWPQVRQLAAEAAGRRKDAKAIPFLIDKLDDKQVRTAATAALAKIGKPATEPLLHALDGADTEQTCAILETLGRIKDPRAVKPLCRMLGDKDTRIRRAAIASLGTIGGDRAAAALAALVKQKDASFDDRSAALSALTGMEPPEPAALISVFEIDHRQFEYGAAAALARIGRPAIEPLVAAAGRDEWTVRRGVAEAIGKLDQRDPRLATVLVDMLRGSEKPQVREVAAQSLGKRKDPEAVTRLIKALKDANDEDFRRWAAVVLGMIGDPRAVEPLIAALEDNSVNVRCQVKGALARIKDPRAIDPLIAASKHEDRYVRHAVVTVLAGKDPRIAKALTAALKDNYAEVRMIAAQKLVKSEDPQAVGPVIDALKAELDNKTGRFRVWAVKLLGQIESPRTVEPLIAALRNNNLEVRYRAATLLGESKDPRAIEPLIAALKDKNFNVPSHAAQSLGRFGDARAVEPLIALLKHEVSWVRLHAAEALGKIKDRRAVEPLIPLLEDEYSDIRCAAATSLGEIGDARAIGPLRTAAKNNKFEQVRAIAEQALKKVEADAGR